MADDIDLTWPQLDDKGNFSVTKDGLLSCKGATFHGSLGGATINNTQTAGVIGGVDKLANYKLFTRGTPSASLKLNGSLRTLYIDYSSSCWGHLTFQPFSGDFINNSLELQVYAWVKRNAIEGDIHGPYLINIKDQNSLQLELLPIANQLLSTSWTVSTTGVWFYHAPSFTNFSNIYSKEGLKSIIENSIQTLYLLDPPFWFRIRGIENINGQWNLSYSKDDNGNYQWYAIDNPNTPFPENIPFNNFEYQASGDSWFTIPNNTEDSLIKAFPNGNFLFLNFFKNLDNPQFITAPIQNVFPRSIIFAIGPVRTISGKFHSPEKETINDANAGFYLNEDGLGFGANHYFNDDGRILCNSIQGTRYTASDKRLKNSIQSISAQPNLSKFFDDLKPVSYKYSNDKNNIGHIGFVADDVRDSLIKNNMNPNEWGLYVPFMPVPGTSDYCKGLRYSEFIALNTSEIQKLKTKMDELEKKAEVIKSLDKTEKKSYNSKEEDKKGDNIK